MRLLLSICLFASTAFAQFDNLAFVGSLATASVAAPTWYPTNVGTAISWYRADTFYTNGTTITVKDECSNAWNLTQATPSHGVYTNAMDGKAYLYFSKTDDYSHLSNADLDNINQPWEVTMLCRIRSFTSNGKVFYATTSSYYEDPGSGLERLELSSGGYMTGSYGYPTNLWVLMVVQGNGANSIIYTNNVIYKSDNAGTGKLGKGFHLGGQADFAGQGAIDIAQVVIYSPTNSAADRNTIYNYFKTNYPSASLP